MTLEYTSKATTVIKDALYLPAQLTKIELFLHYFMRLDLIWLKSNFEQQKAKDVKEKKQDNKSRQSRKDRYGTDTHTHPSTHTHTHSQTDWVEGLVKEVIPLAWYLQNWLDDKHVCQCCANIV